MKKQIFTIILSLLLTAGASAQQEAGSSSVAPLRGCRVGTPRSGFTIRRAPSLSGGENPLIGNRRQLVVLAAFQDMDLEEESTLALQKWNKIFNTENYTEGEYMGSVHDYFLAQSYGKLNLSFDLYYVKLPDNRYKYRSTAAHDENSQYMVDDIVDVLQTQDIDWSLYDWNGDSYVEQILIVYAGEGMNAGGGSNSIWPHQWWLSLHLNQETEDKNDCRSFRTVVYDEKEYYVDCYCCVQEIVDTDDTFSSFGTICHEYSHCFGLPDFYYSDEVVGYWDLMDSGNYNGMGFRPCNYSAHERMLMGWITPVELNSTTTITDMSALDIEPVSYLIRNDGEENEYYIVENRQQQGWDEFLPGSGIVVFHVDYDQDLWHSTTQYVNTSGKKRYRIIPANNTPGGRSSKWAYPYITKDVFGNDLLVNDQLTDTSVPAATLNNPNLSGQNLMSKPITRMAVDANGLASFVFMDETTPVHDVTGGHESLHDEAAPMYDLQGRRISEPVKGLYIKGGKLRIKN